jgi:hypothetical protein
MLEALLQVLFMTVAVVGMSLLMWTIGRRVSGGRE